jgi:Cu-processing system permease protein
MLAYFISSFLVFYYFFGVNFSFIKFSILILSLIPLFVSIGMFCAFLVEDRLRGIGLSLLLWFAFCILYDTFLLYMAVAFSDYPIEKPLLLLTLLNPIDLLRLSFLVDAGLYEFIGSIGRPLLVYLKKWWFLPSLCSLFYTLIFYALGFRVFKGKDM